MPLPSPLSSLLQLPKTMEGTASWLRGCFLAVGTVDSSGAAATSHSPEDMNDTEAEATHCCQKQLNTKRNIFFLFIQLSSLLRVPLFGRTDPEIIRLRNLEI